MSNASTALPPDWHILTSRLNITPLLATSEHADFIVELYNTPLFIAGPGNTGITTREKALNMINGFVAGQFEKNGHGIYLLSLRDGGKVIGTVSLIRFSYTEPDVGFALLPDYTGKGYAQEAGKAIMEYATRSKDNGGLGYAGVFGFTSSTNAKSKRVCESLGLQFRGDYLIAAFGSKPSAVYTMQGMDLGLEQYGINDKKVDGSSV